MIAFDVTPLQNGHRTRGIGTYVRGLSGVLLQQEEVPIEFWGWADDRPFEVKPPHRAMWLKRAIPRTRYPSLLRPAMRVRSLLSRAHAVHITDPNALAGLGRRKLMTTVYDLIPLHGGDVTRNYRHYLAQLKSVPGIFAISQATADDLTASLGIPRERIVVAPPGVKVPKIDPSGVPPVRGPFFFYIGSPDPHKNLGVLVDAMKLCPDLPEKLVLAGDWPAEAVAAVVASGDAGRVVHTGYLSAAQVLAAMRAATAVVMPSLMEGFGLPVAEAIAAGAAVIHSRLPVMEEISAGCALTFNPSSPDELAACLRSVSRDEALRRNLQECGRERAAILTWDRALRNTLDVYREVLDNKSRQAPL